MSSWNRSYLEAMNVPVWVSRLEVVTNIATESVEAEVSTKADAQLVQETALSFVSVAGNLNSVTCILVTEDQDLQQAKSNFLLMAQAWKQWQDTDLPLALLQLVEQEHSTENAEQINELKDKQLLLASNQSLDIPHLIVKPAPTLNWQSASDKKAWWQLIQQLV